MFYDLRHIDLLIYNKYIQNKLTLVWNQWQNTRNKKHSIILFPYSIWNYEYYGVYAHRFPKFYNRWNLS